MPKTPINYQKSVIYKICCEDVSILDCYVGSTTNLSRRKPQHKCKCNSEHDKGYNYNVYQFIRAHGGWDNWDVVVVEEYPCENKEQLHTRERYHVELLNSTLNKVIPTRTTKEWREDNAGHFKARNKQYGKDNAEHLKAYQKAYQSENAEHIKAREKEYEKDNVEHIKALYKQRYKDNAEKIKAYGSEKIPCPHCNKILSRGYMTRHIKSQHTE